MKRAVFYIYRGYSDSRYARPEIAGIGLRDIDRGAANPELSATRAVVHLFTAY
jgi:hypothetical protein